MEQSSQDFTHIIRSVRDHERNQLERSQGQHQNPSQISREQIDRVLDIAAPVIQAFIDGDTSLSLVEPTPKYFHGFLIKHEEDRSCRISITTNGSDRVHMDALTTGAIRLNRIAIYSGSIEKEEIVEALKSVLLNWYRQLMATRS